MQLAPNALITLEMAKKHLDAPLDEHDDDDAIILYINGASSAIESYIGYSLGNQPYMELKRGRGGRKLVLDNYPVTALDALTVNGEEWDKNSIKIQPERGMLIHMRQNFPQEITKVSTILDPHFEETVYNIIVEYQAGYILPKDATPEKPSNLPFDIQMICLRILSNLVKEQEVGAGKNLLMKREQIGDWYAEYERETATNDGTQILSADSMLVLDIYKRVDITV